VTEILHPETLPHAGGMLDVGDGNHMRWAAYGNPSGKPAAVVHADDDRPVVAVCARPRPNVRLLA
jgi:hypothetical protein